MNKDLIKQSDIFRKTVIPLGKWTSLSHASGELPLVIFSEVEQLLCDRLTLSVQVKCLAVGNAE